MHSHRCLLHSHRGLVHSHRCLLHSHHCLVHSHRDLSHSHRCLVRSHHSPPVHSFLLSTTQSASGAVLFPLVRCPSSRRLRLCSCSVERFSLALYISALAAFGGSSDRFSCSGFLSRCFSRRLLVHVFSSRLHCAPSSSLPSFPRSRSASPATNPSSLCTTRVHHCHSHRPD